MDNGVYKGLSPTDASGVGMGEIRITFTDDSISYVFATGLEVATDEVPRTLLRDMTTDEVRALFEHTEVADNMRGYVLNETGAIFLETISPETPDEFGVLVLRFVSDEFDMVFGPTLLYTPSQVEAGYFDAAIAVIETDQGDPGVIPRIANGGRRG